VTFPAPVIPAAPAKPPLATPPPHVEKAVLLLARAIQRVRAYPHGSPLTSQALDAAQRALASLDRDTLVVRAAQRTLLVDDLALTSVPPITELAVRLHQASIGTLTIAREASGRDLSVFCRELVTHDPADAGAMALPDSLRERGIEKLTVTIIERPAVLEIGLPPSARVEHLNQQHTVADARRETAGHVYPAGKGWVRTDPGAATLGHVSLTDLAQLVGDPFALAEMLVALSDDPPAADPTEALERKFEDIATLFSATDPATAETLLAGLARALLALDQERRRHLLRDSILPGLIEGRLDSGVLRHLPDLELADSLSLLLDLQVAAPELLGLALDRLELSDERRGRVEPLLRERLESRDADREFTAGAIDGYADGRIKVDLSQAKEFRDFASFNLAIDALVEQTLATTRQEIAATDQRDGRIGCLLNLVALEANPEPAARLLAAAQALLNDVRQAGRWASAAQWIERLGVLHHEALTADRPEIAESIASSVRVAVDDAWVIEAARSTEADLDASIAARLITAPGAAIVPALIKVLDGAGPRTPRPAIVKMMSVHATPIAGALATHLGHANSAVVRDLLTILGHAENSEPMIASVLNHSDQHVVRQAYRALVQLGTAQAIGLVAARLASGDRSALADDAFWRFPVVLVSTETRRLLGDAAFVSAHPQIARRLVEKAAERRLDGMGIVLGQLATLRRRFWRPAHMRLGMAAARLQGSMR
jgi:hypothetical protein